MIFFWRGRHGTRHAATSTARQDPGRYRHLLLKLYAGGYAVGCNMISCDLNLISRNLPLSRVCMRYGHNGSRSREIEPRSRFAYRPEADPTSARSVLRTCLGCPGSSPTDQHSAHCALWRVGRIHALEQQSASRRPSARRGACPPCARRRLRRASARRRPLAVSEGGAPTVWRVRRVRR